MAKTNAVIRAHTKIPLDQRLISEPEFSKEFGATIQLNFLGGAGKVCSFNCAYCEFGPTKLRLNQLKDLHDFPRPIELLDALHGALALEHSDNTPVDTILLTGQGEPTLNPHFPEIIDGAVDLRNQYSPRTKLVLVTNAMHFDKKKYKLAAMKIDTVMVKVDAGNEEMLKQINDPLVRTNTNEVSLYLRDFKNVIVNSHFVTGAIDNTTAEHIDDWMEVVGMIGPEKVYIRTIKSALVQSGITPAKEEQLFFIAQRLQRKSKIEVSVIA